MHHTPTFSSKWARNPFQIPYSERALAQDLKRLHESWRAFQSSRDRNAVFPFLSAVFELVRWWSVEKQAPERAELALVIKGIAVPKTVEPYAAIVIAAAHPTEVDRKLVNKWTRAMRYAVVYKSPNERLGRFIRARGGLNACTTEYSHRLGRQSKRGPLRRRRS
jgi:hypothetical protein